MVEASSGLTARKGRVETLVRWRPYAEEPSLIIGTFPRHVPTIHLNSHFVHYGSSVFEGIRFYNVNGTPHVFRLQEHVDRWWKGIHALLPRTPQLPAARFPLTKEALKQMIIDTVARSGLQAGYIRPLAGWGEGPLGVGAVNSEFIVHVQTMPWGKYLAKDAVHAHASSVLRKTPFPSLKMGGAYHAGMIAHFEANKHGADEAILFNPHGEVAEGSGENLFLVDKSRRILYTSPPKAGEVLPGITRDAVMRFARQHRLRIVEKRLSIVELAKADELFFTGTAAEVTPIGTFSFRVKNGRIDIRDESRKGSPFLISLQQQAELMRVLKERGVKWKRNGVVQLEFNGGKAGEITARLKARFYKIIGGQDRGFAKWLTPITPTIERVSFKEWERKQWFSGVRICHYQSPESIGRWLELRGKAMQTPVRYRQVGLGLPTTPALTYRNQLLHLNPEQRDLVLQAATYAKQQRLNRRTG